MYSGIVALGGLKGGRYLHAIHVPWFYLRLHQTIENPVNLLCQDAQVPDLWLKYNGLSPVVVCTIIGIHINADNGEETPGVMADAAI